MINGVRCVVKKKIRFFSFYFVKKNVPLRYYKEPKINSMIPNFQYPTPNRSGGELG